MIVNDTHPYPGIVHPGNFWSATIMATRSQLLCDKPYYAYDLLAGGQEIRATPTTAPAGRFTLPVNFDRCSGRAFILTERPIRALTATAQPDANGELTLSVRITDDQQRDFQTPLPCEITRLDAAGRTIETLYRALGPKPSATGSTLWLHDWWGAPGWLDKIIRADATAQPRWQMSAPRWSGSFQGWQHPGSRWLPDPTTDDLFIAGHHQLARLTAAGKVIWQYDDRATANDGESFRFSRDLMLHDLSSLAVYEDPAAPARYTDTYALFLHDAKRNQWLQAGHVTDNRSPYNLFTFPAIEADAITYLWLRSPGGHARLAELEAYSPPADLLD